MAKDKKKKASPKSSVLGKVLAGVDIVGNAAVIASMASLKVSPLATFGWTFVEQIYEAVRDLPAADRVRLREQVQKMTDEAMVAELEKLGKSQREGAEVQANLTRSVIEELTCIRAELPPYDQLLVRLDAMGTAQRYQLDDFLTRLPLALNDCLRSRARII